MGCNVDKAKADIYDILTEDQKDFSESSIKRTEQLTELISEKLDSEIKSKFVMSINDNNKNNVLDTEQSKDNDTSEDTNNSKNENKHSALVKAESILKDIDKANSEVSKFIKPLMRDYFNSKRLSVKPFVNAISLALNGDIGQKATAQKGIDAIFEITRTIDQKDVPFEKFTNEEINFLVDNHFMSEPEMMDVDKKDLDLNVKQTTINFDNINIFGSQNRTNENIEESGSFSNTIGGLLESLVDVNDTSAYGKNMINIATTMIDTLNNYGLNKTLKVNIYSIKDKNDRYTRASFAMDANSTATERIDQTTGNVIGFDLEAGEIYQYRTHKMN